ncbi:probable disease resistance protein At4g27220 [Ziziphus jujuba]|uniref:Probable disease resistance protein At4g27220 n=1 Tax=Ziziphus jujuba TaxID=326968 RepID=A0ABM3IDM9_ZIZJJ|nr:probable disease resistance protein At4g27220 [Ziziphus jujuba]
MDFLIAVGSTICEYTVDAVAGQLGHIYHYKRNVDNLKSQIQRLEGEKARMQHSIEEAGRNGEEIEGAVEEWMNEVTWTIEKAHDEFFRDEDYAMPLCSSKMFPNLVSRRRLSMIANSLAETAGDEMQRANTLIQKVSYRVPLQSAAIEMTKGSYMIFQSRTPIFNGIMEALRNPDVKMIGVYGMGGIGKTMLAKEVARKAVEDDEFKKTVFVTVSHTPDLHKIQKEIANQLGLKFGETVDDKYVRAKRLSQQLGREKKMLLVIDDIWEKLDLYGAGITFRNGENDCKILLTSRFRNVVCDAMDAHPNFCVEDLCFDEAKDLFDKIVGDQSIKNPAIQALEIKIVKECAGLPIALETVANALKKKDYPIWSNALQELRRSAPTNIEGMKKNVYCSMKLSYDFLGSEEAKSLLLICSLLPEDKEIETEILLKYVMGLPELFQGITNLEEARNRVLTLVDILKASSLLLNVDSRMDTTKMHDVVRDVVIFIGSEKHNMFRLRKAVELEDNKKLKVATAISLPNFEDDAHQLPKKLEFPQLMFFHICNPSLQKAPNFQIPNYFFEATKELQVLNLTSVCLKPLPSSFEFLENLHTLFLNWCEIEDVALIGELRNLKILDLAYSKIGNLPGQIGQLTRLRLLDLSYCSKLEVIECNVISNLVHLEELYMFGSFTRWDIEEGNSGRRNACLMELKDLSRLTTLHLHIPDVNVMPKESFTMNLERYDILIGEGPTYLDDSFAHTKQASRKLELTELNISRVPERRGLEALLKRSVVLNLYGSTGVNNVIHELNGDCFPELMHLSIVNNDEMQYIINSMDQRYHSQNAFFPSLETLQLENVKKLEKIWHGELLTNSFVRLRVVKVKDCERLKNLLSSSSVRGIEEIEVINCKMMSEIVTYGREDVHPHIILAKIEFPHLRSLILKSSPNLAHFPFSKLEATFSGHRKEEEPLLDVNSPLPFFYPMVALPSLKDLKLSNLNSEKLLPDHPPENFNMQNLTNLKIHGCNSLKYLLSFSMATNIVQIEHLEVRECSVMEDVLAINDKERMVKKELLPNLKSLVLDNLPNLGRFCSKRSWGEFSSLARLRINNCPKLEIEDSIWKLPQLQRLILKRINVAQKAMWNCQYEIDHEGLNEDDQEHAGIFPCLKFLILVELTDRLMDTREKNYHSAGRAFQNLKYLFVFQGQTLKNLVPAFQALRFLVVSKCHGMEYLLTPSTAKSLTQLRTMVIEKCERMIQIIADYNRSQTEEGTEIVFDRLEELALVNLQNLRNFYSGNCVMRFPNLKRLIFEYCPQIVSFCEGNISTPKLKKLILYIDADGDGDIVYDNVMEFDFDKDGVLLFDDCEFSSFPMQQLEEGDINAATRKLWLNNQG